MIYRPFLCLSPSVDGRAIECTDMGLLFRKLINADRHKYKNTGKKMRKKKRSPKRPPKGNKRQVT